MMLSSMADAMQFLAEDISTERSTASSPAAVQATTVVDLTKYQEEEEEKEHESKAMHIEDHLADFLAAVLFDDKSVPSDSSRMCYKVSGTTTILSTTTTTTTTTTTNEESVPDMKDDEEDDDSVMSLSSSSPSSSPFAAAADMLDLDPEDSHACPDCASNVLSIGCTGCGQRVCLKHACHDGEGGKGTFASSPGGYICANCMVYHYFLKFFRPPRERKRERERLP